jgi:formylglycine-generating enzyme required for sulfatase activity
MTLVEAGEFLYGEANEPRFLPAFYMDVFPTTNADYARFVTATRHRAPQHWSRAGEPPGNLLEHPVVFVTWHDAQAYASWAAKSLPSNEQWEKAARGERKEGTRSRGAAN